jgi:hypothetical protein
LTKPTGADKGREAKGRRRDEQGSEDAMSRGDEDAKSRGDEDAKSRAAKTR